MPYTDENFYIDNKTRKTRPTKGDYAILSNQQNKVNGKGQIQRANWENIKDFSSYSLLDDFDGAFQDFVDFHEAQTAHLTLRIDTDYVCTANITANFTIAPRGGVISDGGAYAFTLNGEIEGRKIQIFDTTASVTLSSNIFEVYPEWWGAFNDDGSTEQKSFVEAAILSGIKDIIFSQKYRIKSALSQTISNDINFISRNGGGIISDGGYIMLGNTTVTKNITVNATRGDYDVVVNNNTDLAVGDICYIDNGNVEESSFGVNGYTISRIAGIAGTTITLEDPINFGIDTLDSPTFICFTTNYKFNIDKMVIDLVNISDLGIRANGFDGCYYKNIKVNNISAATAGVGLSLYQHIDPYIEDVHGAVIQYTVLVNMSRNIKAKNITLRDGSHPISFAAWCNTVHAENITGSDCDVIESHPCFDVNYLNCVGNNGGMNLRCVGGSIKNCRIEKNGVTTGALSIHNLTLSDPTIYDEYDLIVEDSYIKVEAKTVGAAAGRKVIFKNCDFPNGFDFGAVSEPDNVVIKNCEYNGVYRDRGLDVLVSDQVFHNFVDQNPTNRYDLELWRGNINHEADKVYARGKVFEDNSGSASIATKLRFSHNWTRTWTEVMGHITIKCALRHANAVGYTIREEKWEFLTGNTLSFTTTPVSVIVGVAGAITFTLATPAKGSLGVYGDYRDNYTEFDFTVASANTNPRYIVWYELEMYGANL